MANPIVTSLPKYVDETKEQLIAKSVLGAKTASLLTLQVGVKGDTDLHLLDTNVVFGDGSQCGWDDEGTSTISRRTLKPVYLKVNTSFCEKNLLNTYASHRVSIAAGNKTLPYEEDFTNHIVENVQYKVEKMIWQGSSANTLECSGLVEIADKDGAVAVTATTGTSAYEFIKKVYANAPESAIQKGNFVIFVGAGLFRKFIQEIVAANLYHYDGNDTPLEYVLPGTSIRVIAVNGLNDTADYDYAFGACLDNVFYGTDMISDSEDFELWYSLDNREFRLAIEFIMGVQIAYPNEVVLGKLAK